MQLRKEVNRLDNLATGATVDSLINVETIQHFDNAAVRSNMYNGLLHDYQTAALQTEAAACALNAGQAVTQAIGIAATNTIACLTVPGITAGDLVLVTAPPSALAHPHPALTCASTACYICCFISS